LPASETSFHALHVLTEDNPGQFLQQRVRTVVETDPKMAEAGGRSIGRIHLQELQQAGGSGGFL
jgi:hypothetical protein